MGTGWTFHELKLDLQYVDIDVNSRRAWTICIAQQWLKYHLQPPLTQVNETFAAYFERVSLHGRRTPIKDAGPRLRELYSTLMHPMMPEVAVLDMEPKLPSEYMHMQAHSNIFIAMPRMTQDAV